MPQSSYPQGGLFPADGPDCGAYTASEWRGLLLSFMRAGGMVNTGAAAPPGLPTAPMFPNVGIFYVCPDRLVVTSTGNSKMSIATGAWLCDGAFGYNDTAITDAAIANPAANPRIDRVVVRQNYSGVDYTSVNVPSLIVPDNTARLCVISGAEAPGPVAPTPTQDQDRTTYWDIPLYQYEISVAGVITNLTDEREWVDAETKRFFVETNGGCDTSVPAAKVAGGDDLNGLELTDTHIVSGYGDFAVPNNYIDAASLKAVVQPLGTGFIYSYNQVYFSECGEDWSLNTDREPGAGYAQVAITDGKRECIQELDMIGVTIGDLVSCKFSRNSNDANDTIDANVQLYGWLFEYLGWGRK